MDVIFAALFLLRCSWASSLPNATAPQTGSSGDWRSACARAPRYVALVYAPVWLAIVLMRRATAGAMGNTRRRGPRAAVVRPELDSCRQPNLPLVARGGGTTLAHGAFSHAAMANSIFHVDDLRLLPFVVSDAFGPALFFFWLPFAVVGAIVSLPGAARGWRGCWWFCRSRWSCSTRWWCRTIRIPCFLFPAVALGDCADAAFAFVKDAIWNRAAHAAYALGLLWLIVGVDANFRMQVADMPFSCVTGYGCRAWCGLDISSCSWRWASRPSALATGFSRSRSPAPGGWPLVTRARQSVSSSARGLSLRGLQPPEPYADVPSRRDDRRLGLGPCECHRPGQPTGDNIPYPLFGERLTNHVYLVNINRRLDWTLADYNRARQKGQENGVEAATPRLSSPRVSGVLKPVVTAPGRQPDAVRPRFERMHRVPRRMIRESRVSFCT